MDYNFDEKDVLMEHIWNPAWATVQYGILGWLQVVQNHWLWSGDLEDIRLVAQVLDGLQGFPLMNARQAKTVQDGVAWYRWYEGQCEYQQLDSGEGVSDYNDTSVQGYSVGSAAGYAGE